MYLQSVSYWSKSQWTSTDYFESVSEIFFNHHTLKLLICTHKKLLCLVWMCFKVFKFVENALFSFGQLTISHSDQYPGKCISNGYWLFWKWTGICPKLISKILIYWFYLWLILLTTCLKCSDCTESGHGFYIFCFTDFSIQRVG